MNFGQRLKRLREEKNLSQTELARILNLSQPTIAYYESGEKQPTNENLIRLADFFNVSTDYLLGRTNFTFKDSLLERNQVNSESRELAKRIDKASEKTKQVIRTILEIEESKDKQSAAGE